MLGNVNNFNEYVNNGVEQHLYNSGLSSAASGIAGDLKTKEGADVSESVVKKGLEKVGQTDQKTFKEYIGIRGLIGGGLDSNETLFGALAAFLGEEVVEKNGGQGFSQQVLGVGGEEKKQAEPGSLDEIKAEGAAADKAEVASLKKAEENKDGGEQGRGNLKELYKDGTGVEGGRKGSHVEASKTSHGVVKDQNKTSEVGRKDFVKAQDRTKTTNTDVKNAGQEAKEFKGGQQLLAQKPEGVKEDASQNLAGAAVTGEDSSKVTFKKDDEGKVSETGQRFQDKEVRATGEMKQASQDTALTDKQRGFLDKRVGETGKVLESTKKGVASWKDTAGAMQAGLQKNTQLKQQQDALTQRMGNIRNEDQSLRDQKQGEVVVQEAIVAALTAAAASDPSGSSAMALTLAIGVLKILKEQLEKRDGDLREAEKMQLQQQMQANIQKMNAEGQKNAYDMAQANLQLATGINQDMDQYYKGLLSTMWGNTGSNQIGNIFGQAQQAQAGGTKQASGIFQTIQTDSGGAKALSSDTTQFQNFTRQKVRDNKGEGVVSQNERYKVTVDEKKKELEGIASDKEKLGDVSERLGIQDKVNVEHSGSPEAGGSNTGSVKGVSAAGIGADRTVSSVGTTGENSKTVAAGGTDKKPKDKAESADKPMEGNKENEEVVVEFESLKDDKKSVKTSGQFSGQQGGMKV